MEKIDVMTGYRADRKDYCGRVDVQMMFFIALAFMALSQLFITIWYLTYHVWYWFIVLTCILVVAGLVFMTIRSRNPVFLLPVMIYQILFVLLCIGASINLIVLLCHPHSNSYIYRRCAKDQKSTYDDCIKQVRIASGVYFPIYFAFALLNLWCWTVLWAFYRSLSSSPLPSYNPRAATEVQNTTNFAYESTEGPPKPQEERRPSVPAAGGRTEFPPHPTERVEPDWGAAGNSPGGTYNPDYLNYRQEELHAPAFPPPPKPVNNHLYDTTPSW